MKVSELTKFLSKNGCYLVGHGAEHDKWQSVVTGNTFYLPRHQSKEIKKGTLAKILKLAGIKNRDGGEGNE